MFDLNNTRREQKNIFQHNNEIPKYVAERNALNPLTALQRQNGFYDYERWKKNDSERILLRIWN